MKMTILELEYSNIRKITTLRLPFTRADGSVINNTFIMMANGTGKTTTMTLIKGIFDGSAADWPATKVRSFAPTLTEADTGEFSITVKFDDKRYKYFLTLDYKNGTAQIDTQTSVTENIKKDFCQKRSKIFLHLSLSGVLYLMANKRRSLWIVRQMRQTKRFGIFTGWISWMKYWQQTREFSPKFKIRKENGERPVHLAICGPGKVTLTQFGSS